MEQDELFSRLCAYDKRNPYYVGEKPDMLSEEPGKIWRSEEKKEAKGQCYCDNCFYGRTALAEEILKLQDQLKNYQNNGQGKS